ncbi:MAG TPA: hypothetical protein VF777_04735 [Phycisphaerales bacterium]
MLELFFGGGAGYFALPAALGTSFFIFRMVMLMLGHAHGVDVDLHADVHGHTDPGDAFKILSLQSLAAYSMGFGWGGLGALKGTGWPMHVSLLVAFLCGVAMMWTLGLLLKATFDLQSSGNINIQSAVGAEGDVYVSIPAQGQGQVRLVIRDRQRIFNARSEEGPLETSRRVRVVRVHDDNSVGVIPV